MRFSGPLLILAGLLSACGSAPKVEESPPTGVLIDGFIIRNELAYPVTDVMLEVPSTGAFAGCGNLMPRSQCKSTFETLDYRANGMVISWKEYGESHRTDEFVVDIPEQMVPGSHAMVEAIIFAPGQAGAKLVRKVP